VGKIDDIKRIIIPVDSSEVSKIAVKRGALLAKLLGVSIKVISVNDTHQFVSSVVIEERLKKEAEALLDSFKKIGDEVGVKVETEIISGKPAEEIVKFAKEDDLIIMPNTIKKGIDRIISGSVSEEVVRKAPCSVLVVKSK
jgi:nucleotide-binding universal stress UspA family protein